VATQTPEATNHLALSRAIEDTFDRMSGDSKPSDTTAVAATYEIRPPSTPVTGSVFSSAKRAITGVLGGLISYVAATTVVSLGLLSPDIRSNVSSMARDNAKWFVASGVCVAAAQGFFFAAVAVAPVMLVMPLLQFSLVFRMLFSTWLNPRHEIVGPLVLAGVAISVAGALMVSIDSTLILRTLAVPEPVARWLLWSV
jgi:uncharacterized membrane protein